MFGNNSAECLMMCSELTNLKKQEKFDVHNSNAVLVYYQNEGLIVCF